VHGTIEREARLQEQFPGRGIHKGAGRQSRWASIWVGNVLGLPGSPKVEHLVNCEVFKSQFQGEAKDSTLKENEVYVVASVGMDGTLTGVLRASSQVESVYGSLKDANQKVQDVTAGYRAHLNSIADRFGWDSEEYFYNGRVYKEVKKEDGTLIWAALRDYSPSDSGKGTASIAVWKRTIDQIDISDVEKEER
jgi:hypothetical protein